MNGCGTLVKWYWQGKMTCSKDNPLACATLSTTNPTWTGLKSSPGLCANRSVTNCQPIWTRRRSQESATNKPVPSTSDFKSDTALQTSRSPYSVPQEIPFIIRRAGTKVRFILPLCSFTHLAKALYSTPFNQNILTLCLWEIESEFRTKDLTNLHPISSSVTFFPSTIVKAPTPGNTSDFKISVPVPVALIRHTCADSRADCPWSPHSLKTCKGKH